MDIHELIHERAKLIREGEALLDRAETERRDLTAEEKQRFDALLHRIDVLGRQINGHADAQGYPSRHVPLAAEEPFARLVAELGKPDIEPIKPMPPHRSRPTDGALRLLRPDEPFAAAVRHDLPDGIRPQDLSLGRWFRGVVTGNWAGAEAERRAMATFDDTLGGYLLPRPLSSRVIDLARNQSVVSTAGALTVPMDTKELTLARVTQDPQGTWKEENAPATESDMTFGAIRLEARTLVALVRVSVELIEDAQNISEVIERALSEALALELDRAALFSDRANLSMPLGVFYTEGVQTVLVGGANGGQLTNYDPFSSAVQLVEERNGTARAVVLNPRDMGALDRLRDTTGQPLRPPASWERLRKLVSNQIPTNLEQGTSTNASAAFVGDFGQVLLGIRRDITLEVSREAGDAFKNLQVLVRAYLRADVNVMRPEHLVVIKGIIP